MFLFQRITALRENSNFFRAKLKEMGFRIIGSEDSPVIPLMLFHPAKIAGFSRSALEENVSIPSIAQWDALTPAISPRPTARRCGGRIPCYLASWLARPFLHFCGTHEGAA